MNKEAIQAWKNCKFCDNNTFKCYGGEQIICLNCHNAVKDPYGLEKDYYAERKNKNV